MSDIELTHFTFNSHHMDVGHRSVPRRRRNVQYPFSRESWPGAGETERERDSSNPTHLKLGRTLPFSLPCNDGQIDEDARSQVPFAATNYNRGIYTPEDLGDEDLLCNESALEDDHLDRYSDRRLLLRKGNQYRDKRRRRISDGYQKKTLRTFYHSAKALFMAQVRGIGRLFPTSRTSRGTKPMFVRYDQIPQSSRTSFISEEQFWLLLKRFFGLLPIPEQSLGSFPKRNELTYIKNYLKSKPTPTQNGDERDDGRDLVRICTMLTTFIFRDRESKRIFLGTDRRIPRRSQALTWEIFQGFGLIHQFCDELRSKQHSVLHQDAWLRAKNISLPKRQYMLRIWGSLKCLLLKGRQSKKHDPIGPMRCGLLQIYNALATSNVNLPGRSGIEFSHFSDNPVVRRRANVGEWPNSRGVRSLSFRSLR